MTFNETVRLFDGGKRSLEWSTGTGRMTNETQTAKRAPAGTPPFWASRPVATELRGLVSTIVGYCEFGAGLTDDIEMATLVFPLVIGFGEPFEIALGREPSADDRWHSFAAGLYPGPVLIRSHGRSHCIQVNFTPLGAYRFFGIPMSEFASRMVGIDELDAPEFGALRQRLGNERGWERRLDLVERFVTRRIRHGPDGHAAVRHAFGAIMTARGNLRLSDLAEGLDCSRKYLAERFRTEFGLSPKSIARMARFQHALARSRATLEPDWANIALSCGYADQAHFTREFREFAGISPSRWRRAATG